MRRFFAAFLFALPLLAGAQPSPSMSNRDSLEWAAADSSIVVRGPVVSATYSARGGVSRIVIRPDEVLKGRVENQVEFVAFNIGPDKTEQWSQNHTSLLVFLIESTRQADIPSAPQHGALTTHSSLPGSIVEFAAKRKVQAVTMAYECITDTDRILKLTRAAVKESAKTFVRLYDPPPATLQQLGDFAGPTGLNLAVPATRGMEVVARKWLASADKEWRGQGFQAIVPFRSSDNIALIKKFLSDSAWREGAIDILDHWDVRWEPISTPSVLASREMIRIPAGEFTMGGASLLRPIPVHRANLPEYWIGKAPVTVAQFKAYCKATRYAYDWARFGRSSRDDHPMVCVTYAEARAFCQWAGGDLPTESQWEKAARSADGRTFPWGNEWDPTRLHWRDRIRTRWHTTAPVGSYPAGASPYGCLDMLGNAYQYCLEVYGGYQTRAPVVMRSLRGSPWGDPRQTPCTDRSLQPDHMGPSTAIGFRIVSSKPINLP